MFIISAGTTVDLLTRILVDGWVKHMHRKGFDVAEYLHFDEEEIHMAQNKKFIKGIRLKLWAPHLFPNCILDKWWFLPPEYERVSMNTCAKASLTVRVR